MEPVTITASDKEVTYAASSVKTAPTAKTLTYNGQLQQLITAGEADGGEMKYAVTNENKEPEADAYNFDNTSIPAAANAGT